MYHMTVGIVSANKSFCYSAFAYALSVETEVLVQNLLSYFNENKIFGSHFYLKLPLSFPYIKAAFCVCVSFILLNESKKVEI